MPSVSIISTGNEIISGETIDTNSSRISSSLSAAGFDVRFIFLTGDKIDDIEKVLRLLSTESDLLVITGGLGPTDDDNTIAALSRIYGFNTETHQESLIKMKNFFSSSGRTLTDTDLKMVTVPRDSMVIENKRGLAPGFIIKPEGLMIAALPGVPVEMTAMMNDYLIPFLIEEFQMTAHVPFFLTFSGLRESEVNDKIKLILDDKKINWGITAKSGIITVTFYGQDENVFDREEIIYNSEKVFGEYLISPPFLSPEEELIQLLTKEKLKVATAESCTGGLISKKLTDIAGSSSAYNGSVIAYSNEIKSKLLGVSENTLKEYGAVSEKTAAEMAEGVRKKLNADIGISTTGIAGPGGGTKQKPVGTVCFGFSTSQDVVTFTHRMRGDRDMVRNFSSIFAIDYLRRTIKKNQ